MVREYEMAVSRTTNKRKDSSLVRKNIRLARRLWRNKLSPLSIPGLKEISRQLGLSIASGELLLLDGKWYVTHAGLIRVALRRRCLGIRPVLQERLSDPSIARWVFKATVYTIRGSKGFVGYGDADPSNVSSLVHGAEMRVAETRAVNRALRKAYGIGLCSVEELGWSPRPSSADRSNQSIPSTNGNDGHQNGQPRLRDQLCLLIRKHRLDASLVKAYAADYCGTPVLRDASRAQIESFVSHFADWVARDRDAVLCKLNSYSLVKEEVHP
jgi:hypothetical protein